MSPEQALAQALNDTVGRHGWLRSDDASPAEEWLENARFITGALPEGCYLVTPDTKTIYQTEVEAALLHGAERERARLRAWHAAQHDHGANYRTGRLSDCEWCRAIAERAP